MCASEFCCNLETCGACCGSAPQLKRDPLGSTAPYGPLWLAPLGWYDQGGIIRRLDWFNLYETFGISARVRLANYIICSSLVALGMLEIILSFLGLS